METGGPPIYSPSHQQRTFDLGGFGSTNGIEALFEAIEAGCHANTASYRAIAEAGGRVQLSRVARTIVKRYAPTDVEPMTFFHSSSVPPFSLLRVTEAVEHRFGAYGPVTSLQAAALMLRFAEVTGLCITSEMMHRVLIAALLVVGKVHNDCVPVTHDFARTVGISARDLARVETAVLIGVEWRALVTSSDLSLFVARMAPSSATLRAVIAQKAMLGPGAAADDELESSDNSYLLHAADMTTNLSSNSNAFVAGDLSAVAASSRRHGPQSEASPRSDSTPAPRPAGQTSS